MKLFGTVLGVLFLMTTAPAAFAASVKSDYQKDFDFRQLHTFAFKTERASNDPLATNTIEAERIKNALTAQLSANGFAQNGDHPDFIVAFYSRTKQRTQVESSPFGFGPGFGWGYGMPFRGRWRWGYGPDTVNCILHYTTPYEFLSLGVDDVCHHTPLGVSRGPDIRSISPTPATAKWDSVTPAKAWSKTKR